jgi:PAS domain S-box-containing protein
MAITKAKTANPSIYIVEDERIIAKDIEATLRQFGYECVGYSISGEDALIKIPQLKPDLVLMDINLKEGITGVETAEKLKFITDVPVVYLTAYSDDKTLERGKKTEPYGYILKPFEERELHSIIEMALHKYKMEQQLRYNEKWYRTILNSTGEGIVVCDMSGEIAFANPRALELFDGHEQLVVGANIQDIFVAEERPDSVYVLSPVALAEQENYPDTASRVNLMTLKQALKPIDYLIACIRNEENEKTGFVVVMRDIAQQLRAESAARSSEFRYTAIFESARDVIYTLDRQGALTSMNRAFTDLTGYTKEDILGKPFRNYIHADDVRMAVKNFDLVMSGKQSSAHELRVLTRSGEYRYAEITAVPLMEDQRVAGVIGIARDVTLRKQSELELIRAKNVAEQSKKYQEQFLANITHEIRTPMNAIMGMSQLLLQSRLDNNQQEFVDAIKLSAENLLVIINDILDLSKIQAGKMTIEQKPFELDELISGLFSTLKFRAEEKGLKFTYTIQPGAHTHLSGDKIRIHQVLLNILSNAIKFTDAGEVSLHVREVASVNGLADVSFEVTDTGIGIASDMVDVIFDNFKQTSDDTTRLYGGTGLGLTISKQLTELMNGRIQVNSAVGKGSCFTVTLPLKTLVADEKKQGSNRAEQAAKPSLANVDVLVVEDNNFNKLLIKNILLGWKANVDMADNGQIAVDMLRNKHYDLVLMDIQMPVMDGYQATEAIRHTLPAPKSKIPIIAVTAHATITEREKCQKAGMNDFVSKPIDNEKLFAKMKSLIENPEYFGFDQQEQDQLIKINQDLTDLSYLKEISGGNEELMKEMVNIFLTETPDMLDGLVKSAETEDWKTFREIAHKIKPSITYAGIISAERLIEKIHHDAKSQTNLDEIPGLLPEFVSVCRAAIEELKVKVQSL